MNLKWAVVPGVLAAAACAVNQDDTSAGRSSSRAEGDGTGAAMAPDAGASQRRVAAACVRTTRIPLFGGTGEAFVTAINENGHIVGAAPAPDGTTHLFYWNGSELTDLTPEGGYPSAKGLNNREEVIFEEGGHAFLWRDGQRIDLGGIGGGYTSVEDINDAGQIVGSASIPEDQDNRKRHAFLWENGVLRDLGSFGYDTAIARFINENGKIFGDASSRPASGGPPPMTALFTWENGIATTITRPSEYPSAVGINADGTLALRSAFYDGPPSGYLWKDGVFTAVRPFDAYSVELADLNDRGDVAGNAETGPDGPSPTPESRGFFWRNGTAQTVSAPNGGVVHVRALNDEGVVVGAERSFVNDFVPHAVAWKDGRSIYLDREGTLASVINQHGMVAGSAGNEARIWDTRGCFQVQNGGGGGSPAPDAGAGAGGSSGSSGGGGKAW